MKKQIKNRLVLLAKFGIGLSIFSFLVGTFLFISYMFSGTLVFLTIGIVFVPFAILLNLMFFLILILAKGTPEEKAKNKRVTLRMLINLPIAIAYFCIVEYFGNHMGIIN